MTEENKQAAGAQEATPVAEPAKAETVKEAPATFRFVLGEKVGMTQLFDEKGNLHGVSVYSKITGTLIICAIGVESILKR